MSIIIPSKNIYNIENPKVIKNRIQSVKIATNSFSTEKEYDTTVFNGTSENVYTVENLGETKIDKVSDSVSAPGGARSVVALGIVGLVPYYVTIRPVVKKYQDNIKVLDIFYGKDDDGNAQIGYTVYGKKRKGTFTFPVTFTIGGDAIYDLSSATHTETTTDVEKNTVSVLQIPETTKNFHFKAGEKGNLFAEKTITATMNEGNLKYPTVEVNNDNELSLLLTPLSGAITYQGTCEASVYSTEGTKVVNFQGEYEVFEPVRAEVSINGNVISLQMEEKTQSFNGETNPFTAEGNEFFQSMVGGEAKNAKSIADKILQNYSVGKETATIDCSISDYYDENDNLVISPNKRKQNNAEFFWSVGKYKNTTKSFLTRAEINLATPTKGETTFPEFTLVTKYYDSGTKKTYILDERKINVTIGQSQTNYSFGYGVYLPNDVNYAKPLDEIYVEVLPFDNEYSFTEDKYDIEGGTAYVKTFENIPIKENYQFIFNIGDTVKPKIFSSKGVDVAMSKKQNGEDKDFVVVGRELYYDGSVMQKLYLQEITT